MGGGELNTCLNSAHWEASSFLWPYKKIVEIYYLAVINYMKIFYLVIVYDIITMWKKLTMLTT